MLAAERDLRPASSAGGHDYADQASELEGVAVLGGAVAGSCDLEADGAGGEAGDFDFVAGCLAGGAREWAGDF